MAGRGAGHLAQVDAGHQPQTHVLLEARKQLVEARDVGFDPGQHQRLHRGGEQPQHGLLRAPEAGAVAAGERHVDLFLQQDVVQHAAGLLEIVDADEGVVGAGQIQPHRPAIPERLHRCVGLRHLQQRVVLTNRHTLAAAFAGIRVDGDAEQAAAAFGILLPQRVVGARQREVESAQRLPQPVELLGQFGALVGGCGGGQLLLHGLFQ